METISAVTKKRPSRPTRPPSIGTRNKYAAVVQAAAAARNQQSAVILGGPRGDVAPGTRRGSLNDLSLTAPESAEARAAASIARNPGRGGATARMSASTAYGRAQQFLAALHQAGRPSNEEGGNDAADASQVASGASLLAPAAPFQDPAAIPSQPAPSAAPAARAIASHPAPSAAPAARATASQPAPSAARAAAGTASQPAPSTAQAAGATAFQPGHTSAAPALLHHNALTAQPDAAAAPQPTPSGAFPPAQTSAIPSAPVIGSLPAAPDAFQPASAPAAVHYAETHAFQPAAATSFQPAAATSFQPAAATSFQPAAATSFQPAAATSFQPAAATSFQPAAATSFQPAAATSFQPAAATSFQPAPDPAAFQPATAAAAFQPAVGATFYEDDDGYTNYAQPDDLEAQPEVEPLIPEPAYSDELLGGGSTDRTATAANSVDRAAFEEQAARTREVERQLLQAQNAVRRLERQIAASQQANGSGDAQQANVTGGGQPAHATPNNLPDTNGGEHTAAVHTEHGSGGVSGGVAAADDIPDAALNMACPTIRVEPNRPAIIDAVNAAYKSQAILDLRHLTRMQRTWAHQYAAALAAVPGKHNGFYAAATKAVDIIVYETPNAHLQFWIPRSVAINALAKALRYTDPAQIENLALVMENESDRPSHFTKKFQDKRNKILTIGRCIIF
ncbi:unnamed protein product [Closterium sp. Yama58-4]|nr:unnamed protein product [Closterium sp. Yama58-4]